MKRLLCIVFLAAGIAGAAGAVHADELADANRLLMAKSYEKALPIYQRLAEGGNAEAQMRLGEMYWFGDGTASDLAKARHWFERSAAAGNADAAASLASLKRRETHGDEIVYWTSRYQGEDLVSGQFACKQPDLPAVSRTRADIEATSAAITAWHACYNRFVANVNDALPPGKRIPPETLDMMTPTEGAQAQRHLDAVYSALIKKAQQDALAFNAREDAWRKATETFVTTDAQHRADRNEDLSDFHRRRDEVGQRQMPPPPKMPTK
jgi:TPR repeat protein